MFTAVVATLAVNIAANVVSPANDFANAFPRLIDFKTGGLITGLLGILMQPWKLLADPSGYIFTWLLGYSGGLGSIAGVLIADYWIVRRTALDARGSLPRRTAAIGTRAAGTGRPSSPRSPGAPRVGRARRSGAQAALRLRVVRRASRRRSACYRRDDAATEDDDTRISVIDREAREEREEQQNLRGHRALRELVMNRVS